MDDVHECISCLTIILAVDLVRNIYVFHGLFNPEEKFFRQILIRLMLVLLLARSQRTILPIQQTDHRKTNVTLSNYHLIITLSHCGDTIEGTLFFHCNPYNFVVKSLPDFN